MRLDFDSRERDFQDMGFVKYDNAIAPAPWTLPSHVSIFTGELPSEHGIHESFGVYGTGLVAMSKMRMRKARSNLLRSLRDRGYSRTCLTANPFISPYSGFDFDAYGEFNHRGELSLGHDFLLEGNSLWRSGVSLLKARKLRLLLTFLWWKARTRIERMANLPRLEKGSRHIISSVRKTEFRPPFFLFVNLMEAHEPYRWRERDDGVLPAAVLGEPAGVDFWKEEYRAHAGLAVSRALEVARVMVEYDPLIIVTSDHGQLLGEHGRYGHGYFLDDELLRVPLYVHYPEGTSPLKQASQFVSLTEIPKIVEYVLGNKEVSLGSNIAFSESFGPQLDISEKVDKSLIPGLYSARVKAFVGNGSILFNRATGAVEATEGRPSERELGEANSELEAKKPLHFKEGEETLSPEDEAQVSQRLKELGYT